MSRGHLWHSVWCKMGEKSPQCFSGRCNSENPITFEWRENFKVKLSLRGKFNEFCWFFQFLCVRIDIESAWILKVWLRPPEIFKIRLPIQKDLNYLWKLDGKSTMARFLRFRIGHHEHNELTRTSLSFAHFALKMNEVERWYHKKRWTPERKLEWVLREVKLFRFYFNTFFWQTDRLFCLNLISGL